MAKNPYLDRVALRDTHHFYGRKREVSRIFSRLGAARPQSVAIVGERRMGKSSLLNYISTPAIWQHHLEDTSRYVFIKMDFQERRSVTLAEFFRELIMLILQAADFSTSLTPDFEGVRAAVASLQRKERKLVILFDEFDIVTSNTAFGEEFFSFFRSLANNYDLAYITSSRRDLQELCHTSKVADSPFFNIFSTLNLGVFNRDEALQLITEPSAAAGTPLAPYAGSIISMAGYFPFFLQIACSAFFESLPPDQAEIDLAQVNESFLEEVTPHFNYLWEHFSPEEKNVFHCVQAGLQVPASAQYLFKKLEKEGYLQKTDGQPALFSTFFTDFVAEKAQSTPPMLADTVQMAPPREELIHFMSSDTDKLEKLGQFEIISKLGEGGMGVVYKAVDMQLKRQVAVKVLSPRAVNDSVMRRRFLKEAQSASALNHPNICTIYQVGQAGGLEFIVMEFVEGQTLKEMIRQGPFKPELLARIGIQVADALAHAHEMKMIHRDVKPANIMVNAQGRVKILDFGLVKWQGGANLEQSVTSGLTEQGAILGTVNYMSPEQLKGEELDHRTDIFSLGMVLYEMGYGLPPFAGENYISIMHAILYQKPAPLPATFPEDLRLAILLALEKRPEDRYQNVEQLRRDFVNFLKGKRGA